MKARSFYIGVFVALALGVSLSGCKLAEYQCWAKGQQAYPAKDQNGNWYYYCR